MKVEPDPALKSTDGRLAGLGRRHRPGRASSRTPWRTRSTASAPPARTSTRRSPSSTPATRSGSAGTARRRRARTTPRRPCGSPRATSRRSSPPSSAASTCRPDTKGLVEDETTASSQVENGPPRPRLLLGDAERHGEGLSRGGRDAPSRRPSPTSTSSTPRTSPPSRRRWPTPRSACWRIRGRSTWGSRQPTAGVRFTVPRRQRRSQVPTDSAGTPRPHLRGRTGAGCLPPEGLVGPEHHKPTRRDVPRP